MVTLQQNEYGQARGLLDAVPFNTLMARAVVDGRVDGEVHADAWLPASVYVRHAYGMSFVVGYGSSDRYRARLVELLTRPDSRRRPELLQVYPMDWTDLLDPHVDAGRLVRWGRTNFRFNRARFESRYMNDATVTAAPDGTTPAVSSRDLLERFDGSVIPRHFWRSLDEFVAGDAGCFVVDQASGAPAALAFAAYLDSRFLEIGVETAPAYRGRGCARAACAQLIRRCLERGLTPVWSCRTENEGSMALAQSLGFEPVLQLPYYELPRAG